MTIDFIRINKLIEETFVVKRFEKELNYFNDAYIKYWKNIFEKNE